MSAVRRPLEGLTDDALMLLVQSGNENAFRLLVLRHNSVAQSTARSVIAERGPDAVQDAFASLWRGRHGYRPGIGSVRAWLITIVRRRALDVARAESRRPPRAAGGRLESVGAPGCLEEDSIRRAEGELLRAALARLPAPQREVIVLAYFGGLTHEQIAARLALPEGTVKGRMRLGLDKLRFSRRSSAG